RNAVETRFEKLAQTELKNISVPMELFRIVLPWEHKAEVRGQKSAVREKPVVSTRRRFAFIGGLVLLVICVSMDVERQIRNARSAAIGASSKSFSRLHQKSLRPPSNESRKLFLRAKAAQRLQGSGGFAAN